jgi:cytochrome b6-f complex iron-sulfur subunit
MKIKKNIEPSDPKPTNRRKFLSRIWGILGLVALGEFAFFTVSMLRPGKKALKDKPDLLIRVAGNVDEFPKNSVTADRINKYYIVRMEDGGFLALSLICSHLGCSVIWDNVKGQFMCPCHSSSFDRLGNVISSPAPRPLDFYPVFIEAGRVKVDLSQKKNRKIFDKSQVTYAI